MKMRVIASVAVLSVAAGTAMGQNARVRAVHGSPDAPTVDVLVNDALRPVTGLSFTEASGYVGVPAATYNFKVVPTGGNAGSAVINADIPLGANTDTSVVAFRRLNQISAIVLNDENQQNAGAARVRFVHIGVNVPAVDIRVQGSTTNLFSNVAFGTSGGYVEIPNGGTFALEVLLAGTSTVALTPTVTVTSNQVYTIWAMGDLTDAQRPVRAVVTVDQVPTPGALGILAAGGLLAARRRRK